MLYPKTIHQAAPRDDTVPPKLALAVLTRDHGCVAPRLGGSAMDCWGRNRVEHVKGEPRAARRAEPCLCRLMTLCEGHTEPGMRAGYVWATDKQNRAACRDYLRSFGYGPHVDGHLGDA
jgi:hypothetical protein